LIPNSSEKKNPSLSHNKYQNNVYWLAMGLFDIRWDLTIIGAPPL